MLRLAPVMSLGLGMTLLPMAFGAAWLPARARVFVDFVLAQFEARGFARLARAGGRPIVIRD